MRRVLLIAALALVLPGVACALLDRQIVHVTPSGLKPAVVHVVAGAGTVAWQGPVGSRVVFADGSCRVKVNGDGCLFSIGTHRYRVVGLPASVSAGTVVAVPDFRRVSLSARRTAAGIVLSGVVEEDVTSPPHRITETVTLFARPEGGATQLLRRIVVSGLGRPLSFRLVVHPRRRTTYQAVVFTSAGQFGHTLSRLVTVDPRP
jgi:hypothetical protein